MNIYDYLPELQREPFSKVHMSTTLLKDYPYAQQDAIVTFVIEKMADRYGGIRFFWTTREEGEALVTSWIGGLCATSPRAIFNALCQILAGKTKYVDYPPRSVMQFHDICHHGIHLQMVGSVFPKRTALEAPEAANYGDPAVARPAIAEMRAMLKSARSGRK